MEEFKTISISKSESLNSIEGYLMDFLSNQDIKLRLPNSLNTKGALGIEISLIQLICTWIKFNKNQKALHTYNTTSTEEFSELCSSIYGIASLALIDQIYSKNLELVPRSVALRNAKNTIEMLRQEIYENCFKSRYIGIPYIKKLNYEREFDMPFYNLGKVIDNGPFHRKIRAILDHVIPGTARQKKLIELINLLDLSDLLWESFKNTHDHGRHSLNGDILKENFRCLIVQQQDLTSKFLEKWLGDNPTNAQKKLVKNWSVQDGKFYVLDLSIFDMGEGFCNLAKYKLGESSDNIEIFLKCLEKGWSRFDEPSRGSGLNKVLNCIHKYKGWLRIRTSNLLIEKTFSENDDAIITRDNISVMANEVAGTSLHISIPLQEFGS